MKSVAVLLARVITIFELIDLDPTGKVHFPDLVQGLAGRYSFQKFPQKTEEYDQNKGMVFESGKWERGSVAKLTIFGGGVVVETRSSTDDSEAFLHDALTWGAETFGLRYTPEMTKRKGYVSQVVFQTDVPMLAAVGGAVSRLSNRVSEAVSERAGQRLKYEPTQIWIHYDPLIRKVPIAALTIQRKLEVPFSEGKYFSEGPLPTKQHIEFLESFEDDIKSGAAK